MRRALASILAAVFALGPVAAPAHAADTYVLEATARASMLFSIADVQPAFDPAIVDSRATSSTLGASALNSSVWPSFLVDAFFFLYGFQSVERLGLGIAEARHPQGPHEADATQSNLLFTNAGDPTLLPGKGGRAHSVAAERQASGDAASGLIALPVGTVGNAVASSGVTTTGTVAVAHAEQALHDVVVGPLRIRSIAGMARTEAGATTAALQRLTILGASVGDTPVEITGEGARAPTQAAQEQVNAALQRAGVEVRIAPAVQTTGDVVSASSGGVLIEAHAEQTDPTGTPRNVKLSYLLGSARAASSASKIEGGGASPTDDGEVIHLPPVTIPGPGDVLVGPCACVGPPPLLTRRTVVTTTAVAAPRVGARGAYLAVMLAAFGLVLIRPFLRVISRAS